MATSGTEFRWLDRFTSFVQGSMRVLAAIAGWGFMPLAIIVGQIVLGFWLVSVMFDDKDSGLASCTGVFVVPAGILGGVGVIAGLESLSRNRRACRAIAWALTLGFRAVGLLLWVPWQMVRHPIRSTRAVGQFFAMLGRQARKPWGMAGLLGGVSAGVMTGWPTLEGLPASHWPRILATVLPVTLAFVPVLLVDPSRRMWHRLVWIVGGVGLGALGWMLMPTTTGWTAVTAWASARTLAEEARDTPPDRFAEFRASAPARRTLAAEFPTVAGILVSAEDEWATQAAKVGLAETQKYVSRDGVMARMRAKQLAKELTETQAVAVPGSLAEVRRSVLRVQLELVAWSARPALQGHRFDEAANQVARQTGELEADADELGVKADVVRLRETFAYPAALARVAETAAQAGKTSDKP